MNYDPNIISGEFNEYFVRHPRDICESIPDSRENYMNLIPTNETTMYFNPTSSEEVFRVLKNMRKQGTQSDIPFEFIKMCGKYKLQFGCVTYIIYVLI